MGQSETRIFFFEVEKGEKGKGGRGGSPHPSLTPFFHIHTSGGAHLKKLPSVPSTPTHPEICIAEHARCAIWENGGPHTRRRYGVGDGGDFRIITGGSFMGDYGTCGTEKKGNSAAAAARGAELLFFVPLSIFPPLEPGKKENLKRRSPIHRI